MQVKVLQTAPLGSFCNTYDVVVLCLSLDCYALLCVLSSFAIILKRTIERAGCFAFIVLRMSCYCKCSVALPLTKSWGSLQCVNVVFPNHTHSLFKQDNVKNVLISPGAGAGGTLIFLYIRRLGSFFWVQIFNFNVFWGFQKK